MNRHASAIFGAMATQADYFWGGKGCTSLVDKSTRKLIGYLLGGILILGRISVSL